nr:MAG TPA: hypothetical protein [Caudoviricetes sp.]
MGPPRLYKKYYSTVNMMILHYFKKSIEIL